MRYHSLLLKPPLFSRERTERAAEKAANGESSKVLVITDARMI